MAYINFIENKITDDKDINGVEVDDLICDALILLNKKGYRTLYSCSGHYGDGYYVFESDDLDVINKEIVWEIVDHKDGKYIVKTPILGIGIYIKFSDDIILPSCPKGFYIENNAIYYHLELYDINDVKKPSELIEEEITLVNQDIYDWAVNLTVL